MSQVERARKQEEPVTEALVSSLEEKWHAAHRKEPLEGYAIDGEESGRGRSLHGEAWDSYHAIESEVADLRVSLKQSASGDIQTTNTSGLGLRSSVYSDRRADQHRQEQHMQVRAAPPLWVPDESVTTCGDCKKAFNPIYRRKHHCRRCGNVFCDECTSHRIELPEMYTEKTGHRVCRSCFRHVSSQAPGALLDEEGLRASEDTSIQTEIVVAANAEEEAVRESEATSGNSKDMEHAESWYDGVMNSAGRMFDRS